MKILVLWSVGTRNRADFRMLYDSGVVEKKTTDMLGADHWAQCNVAVKDNETVRRRAVNALANEYIEAIDPSIQREKIDANITIGPIGPIAGEVGLYINLGEVVIS